MEISSNEWKKIHLSIPKHKYKNVSIHELIPLATPNKNAHIEAFNSILEIEFLQPRYFITYGQAYLETTEFMEFYNTSRIHSALKYRTPIEIFESFKRGEEFNMLQ